MFCLVGEAGCCVCIVFGCQRLEGRRLGFGDWLGFSQVSGGRKFLHCGAGVAAAGRGGNAFWKKARQKLLPGIADPF